jgi:hypothetical protein
MPARDGQHVFWGVSQAESACIITHKFEVQTHKMDRECQMPANGHLVHHSLVAIMGVITSSTPLLLFFLLFQPRPSHPAVAVVVVSTTVGHHVHYSLVAIVAVVFLPSRQSCPPRPTYFYYYL